MIDPDLSDRPYADHWRAACIYYDGALHWVCEHGLTFLKSARRNAARELAALEDFLRRLVLMMALALSLPPPQTRPAPSQQRGPTRPAAPRPPQARRARFTITLAGCASPVRGRSPSSIASSPASPHLTASLKQASFLIRLDKLRDLIANPDPIVRRLALRLRAGAPPVIAPACPSRDRPPWFAATAETGNPHTIDAWTFPPIDTS